MAIRAHNKKNRQPRLQAAGRQRRRSGLKPGFAVLLLLAGLVPAIASAPGGSGGGAARPPELAVSIKPLHALVSAVMGNTGAPALIVQGSGSEHGYALRPQDAANLSKADIIFWAGPQMEVFLQKPLQNLSPKAEIITLSAAPGVRLLPARAGGAFALPPGDEGHSPAKTAAAGTDWHFWLDPDNAAAAVAYIAVILAQRDPERAALYHRNAAGYRQSLQALAGRIETELAPLRGRPFIVFHEAYQYFERRFAIPALGAVTVNPEQAPGARRVAAIRARIIKAAGETPAGLCVFSEPQFEPRLVQTLIDGTKARSGVLDPLGSRLPPGPQQYPALIQALADSLRQCLSAARP